MMASLALGNVDAMYLESVRYISVYLGYGAADVAPTQTTNCTAPEGIWMRVVCKVENPIPYEHQP